MLKMETDKIEDSNSNSQVSVAFSCSVVATTSALIRLKIDCYFFKIKVHTYVGI